MIDSKQGGHFPCTRPTWVRSPAPLHTSQVPTQGQRRRCQAGIFQGHCEKRDQCVARPRLEISESM